MNEISERLPAIRNSADPTTEWTEIHVGEPSAWVHADSALSAAGKVRFKRLSHRIHIETRNNDV